MASEKASNWKKAGVIAGAVLAVLGICGAVWTFARPAMVADIEHSVDKNTGRIQSLEEDLNDLEADAVRREPFDILQRHQVATEEWQNQMLMRQQEALHRIEIQVGSMPFEAAAMPMEPAPLPPPEIDQ